jgi:hypothetical protein
MNTEKGQVTITEEQFGNSMIWYLARVHGRVRWPFRIINTSIRFPNGGILVCWSETPLPSNDPQLPEKTLPADGARPEECGIQEGIIYRLSREEVCRAITEYMEGLECIGPCQGNRVDHMSIEFPDDEIRIRLEFNPMGYHKKDRPHVFDGSLQIK